MRFSATVGVELGPGDDVVRHALLGVVVRALAGRARLLAFGFGRGAVHLVLEGDEAAARQVVGRLRNSIVHRLGVHAALGFRACKDLLVDVASAHRSVAELGALCPLESPWSSHRDVMGYRRSTFYDPSGLAELDRRVLHTLAGGRPLPDGWPPPAPRAEPLLVLFNVACEVQGHPPGDRRAFPLFAQLARERGWGPADVADALRLTPRRVHQLLHVPRQRLDVARRWLRHRHAVPHHLLGPPLLAVPVEHAQRLVA